MHDDLPVTDLATRARNGSKQAWDALVDRYAPLIWSICRRNRLSRADATDVGQRIWQQLVDQLATIRDPAAIPGWLATKNSAGMPAYPKRRAPTARRRAGPARREHLVTSSVSGNDICRLCFRIFTLSCCTWSALVRWRPSLSATIVTQLVTQAACCSGMLLGGLSLSAQPLSVGGWPVLRAILQSVSNLFLGGRHGAGQCPALVPLVVVKLNKRQVTRTARVAVLLRCTAPWLA